MEQDSNLSEIPPESLPPSLPVSKKRKLKWILVLLILLLAFGGVVFYFYWSSPQMRLRRALKSQFVAETGKKFVKKVEVKNSKTGEAAGWAQLSLSKEDQDVYLVGYFSTSLIARDQREIQFVNYACYNLTNVPKGYQFSPEAELIIGYFQLPNGINPQDLKIAYQSDTGGKLKWEILQNSKVNSEEKTVLVKLSKVEGECYTLVVTQKTSQLPKEEYLKIGQLVKFKGFENYQSVEKQFVIEKIELNWTDPEGLFTPKQSDTTLLAITLSGVNVDISGFEGDKPHLYLQDNQGKQLAPSSTRCCASSPSYKDLASGIYVFEIPKGASDLTFIFQVKNFEEIEKIFKTEIKI